MRQPVSSTRRTGRYSSRGLAASGRLVGCRLTEREQRGVASTLFEHPRESRVDETVSRLVADPARRAVRRVRASRRARGLLRLAPRTKGRRAREPTGEAIRRHAREHPASRIGSGASERPPEAKPGTGRDELGKGSREGGRHVVRRLFYAFRERTGGRPRVPFPAGKLAAIVRKRREFGKCHGYALSERNLRAQVHGSPVATSAPEGPGTVPCLPC